MSIIRKMVAGRQVHLFQQALSEELQLSRQNVDFIKPPKADQISNFQQIDRGWRIEKLEKLYFNDVMNGYIWKSGFVRFLEAGTYIFHEKHNINIGQIYIPSGDLCSILYYDNENQDFTMNRGDFIIHPLPKYTMLMTDEDIDLFILQYAPVMTDVNVSTIDIEITMALKQFSFTKSCLNDHIWSPVHLT